MSRCLLDWKSATWNERIWEGPLEGLDSRGFNSFNLDFYPLVHSVHSRRAATTFLFDSFDDKDVFGQEVEGWGSSCPPFLPGGKSHTHGFCRKIDLPPKKWYPPENPEPQPGVSPPPAPPRPRVQPQTPQTPWELPAQSIRQEQMLAAQPAQVPVTEVSPPRTQAKARQEEIVRKEMKRERQDVKHHKAIEPPFVSPEAGDDVSPPPSPPPPVKVDPVKPRPPLIIEQKTKIPKREPPEVGIVEEEPSIEEQLLDAAPQTAKQRKPNFKRKTTFSFLILRSLRSFSNCSDQSFDICKGLS